MQEIIAALQAEVAHLQEEVAARQAETEGLKQQLAALKSPKETPPNDWHSMMYLVLSIVLHQFGQAIELMREIVIGGMPPRADFLIKKNDRDVNLGLAIFDHFNKMNIVEYKGPGDDLGEEELWQAVIYLAAQARVSLSRKEATSDDFTITLLRYSKPMDLLKALGEKVTASPIEGIYDITGWKVDVPIRIVATRELKGEEYAGFRALTKDPDLNDVRILMEKGNGESDKAQKDRYKDLLTLLSKVDKETLEEIKRRYPELAEAWMEIFAPEIRESNIRSEVGAIVDYNGDFEGGVLTVARRYGITPADVKAILDKGKATAGKDKEKATAGEDKK